MNFFKLLSQKFFEKLSHSEWLIALLTRLVLAQVFTQAGWGKLKNLPSTIEFFQSLGIPYPELQAPFVAATEFGCGILLFLGLGTRLATLPLISIMCVAIYTAQKEALEPFFQGDVSALFGLTDFLYMVMLGWLLFRGAGALAVDRIFRR